MSYEVLVRQCIKVLGNLSAILDKGAQYADAKKFDAEILLQSRLAPDQFPLVRQIQIACDTAKLGAARLAGKEPPAQADNEKTINDVKARIRSTVAYLESFTARDFAESAARHVTTPRWEGQYLTGEDFLVHHMIPNFYFHVTTAYSILRHNGVDVGKKDYLGPMPFKREGLS